MSSKKNIFGMKGMDEETLQANLNHAKPIELKEKNLDGQSKIFPFWKPVSPEPPEVYHDVNEILSLRSEWASNARKFGKMSPMEKMEALKGQANERGPSTIWKNGTAIGSINNWIEKINAQKTPNLVGVVEPKMADDMKSTASNELLVSQNIAPEVEQKKSAPSRTGVGAVQPKHAEDLNATATKNQVTNVDYTKENTLIVEKSAPSRTGVGAVVPKHSEQMNGTATTNQVTNVDWTKENPMVVKKSAESRTGVGAVQPKMSTEMKPTATSSMAVETSGPNVEKTEKAKSTPPKTK